jgi:hypothetical protein
MCIWNLHSTGKDIFADTHSVGGFVVGAAARLIFCFAAPTFLCTCFLDTQRRLSDILSCSEIK